MIAEMDREKNLAFGYANLNDDTFAEWGYISIQELLDNNAELDRGWRPCSYREAREKIAEERYGGAPLSEPRGPSKDWTEISRVLDFDAIKVRRALEEAKIVFEEKVEMDGSKNQFEMHEFYVPVEVWEKAASIADEAVNL
ncbi:MAG: hypothetical protein HY296_06140 [Thaumarchaeota archaeon]|nr:hypothetical protein [Nitrososphaerota archaeon]